MSSIIPPTVYRPSAPVPDPSDVDDAGPATNILSASECIPSPCHHPLRAGFPRIRGYEILSLIGAGGMGVVYKARQKDLQRIVALKTLHDISLLDVESRLRFQAEAEAVARLRHPNIIQVFEIGTVQPLPGEVHPSPFICLEFIEGGSLDRYTTAPQSPAFAAKMVEKLARAAHAAHSLGVVHRDLKPANVLLTADGEPKLADFGIAKHIGAGGDSGDRFLTQAGIAVGTPEYMAPEQVSGETATPAVDVYALGVILYQLLTARVPFQGATAADTMFLVRQQEPVSPRRLQPGVPRDLETICLKCLAKTPNRRYESAEALADDLARWTEKRPIRARPVGPVEHFVRWMRRNPTVAGLWAAVILVALAGLTGVVWKWRDAETQAVAATQAAQHANRLMEAERWEQYRADILAASTALQSHNHDAARRALEVAPKEFRGWEWQYFSQKLDTSASTLRGKGERVHWQLITPDGGASIAVSDTDVTRFWDIKGRRDLGTIPNTSAMGRSVLSPRGDTVAYIPDTFDNGRHYLNSVVLHDIAAFKTRAVWQPDKSRVASMFYSADGSRMVVDWDNGMVRIYDTATGELVWEKQAHHTPCGQSAFSSDGRYLATVGTSDRSTRVWDLHTGRTVLELRDHPSFTDVAQFNHAGDRLLVITLYPINKLWLYEFPSGKLLAEMPGHKNQILQYEFSPDDRRIATSSRDQTIRLWDGRTGRLIAHMRGHTGFVYRVAFSPDSTRLVSASQDKTVRLWDSGLGTPLADLLGHEGEVFDVAYTPDGKTIVSGSRDATVKLWDAHMAEFGHSLLGHANYVYCVAFHPDGRRVASSAWDGTVRIWDANSRRELRKLTLGPPKLIVSAVAFHPGGKLLASLSRDDTVRLWDVDTGQEVHRWQAPTGFWKDSRLAFSPSGDLLAAGDCDRGVRLWDIASKKEVARLTGHTDTIRDVAFSPDGRWLASAGELVDRTVRIWDVATHTCAHVLEGHTEVVYALAFNRAGTLLASGSLDGTIRLWDTATWKLVDTLTAGSHVHSLAFTPDGARLACGCADNAIRFWDVATRQELAELRGHTDYVHSIAFSPDGTRLVSGAGDHTIRIWDTLATRE